MPLVLDSEGNNGTAFEKLDRVPWRIVACTAALALAGTAALYSLAGGSFQPWAERHATRYLFALALMLAIALTRPAVLYKLAYPAYALALLLLIAVPLVGVEALGAKRWVQVGALTFQPSEIMKLALVLALARFYHDMPAHAVQRLRKTALPLLMIALPVALTLKQPDLGSAVLFTLIGLTLMFLAGVRPIFFVGGALGVMAALPQIYARLHDYQRRRLEIFLDPDRDPLGAGYHITQAKIALGSGGLWGKGFMQGTQSRLDFVPEKHTDFVAAMLGEEWGFLGLLALIAIYGVLLFALARGAARSESRFGQLMIAGAAMTVFSYVFINLAMITGLVPVVGIPLPLISYGGSSMMSVMTGLGLAMSAIVHGQVPVSRGDSELARRRG